MTNPVVVDSTCLIGLERIEHLDILPALFEPILIPPAVQHEFGISLSWLQVEAAIIPALKPLLDQLELNGFYLNEALKAEAINIVGQ